MTDRLKLYNAALRFCGAARLASLSVEGEARRLLDDVWDDGFIRKVLEKAFWKFALRTQRLDADPTLAPDFGLQFGFEKGADWVKTAGIWADDSQNVPLLRYRDETGFLYADQDEIFVSFVSDDATFGGDLSTWPGSVQEYASAYLASLIIHKLTSDKERVAFLFGGDGRAARTGYVASSLKTARASDAMDGPTRFLPAGSWTRSRGGAGRGDGGNRGSLIG